MIIRSARLGISILFVLACAVVGSGAARAAERWALVVGNAVYEDAAVPGLANTVNDARTMAASLTDMGFQVYLVENARKNDIAETVARIAAEQSGANLGLFFFAGHGLQQSGVNYILPSDMNPTAADFLQTQTVALNDLLRDLKATGIGQLVVILDSCRNSPFGDDQAFGTGLALVDAPEDTIIAYSTAPGAVALDGAGKNSPFTAALASILDGPGQDIRDILRLVRAKVRFATDGAQTPWFIDNTRSEMFIQPRAAIALSEEEQSALAGPITLASTAWQTISRSSDVNDFEQFAQLFSDNELAPVALRQLSLLRGSGLPDLPPMDLGVPDPNPDVPDGLGTIITGCDVLATGIGDVYGLVEPVPHDLVNTRAALRACIAAVSNDPQNPRLNALLGRVLRLEGRFEEAKIFFDKAVSLGSSTAFAGLVELYRFGLGVPQDLTKAAEYARAGAMMGNAPLRLVLAGYYKQGWGVPQSFSEARRWLEIASYSGYPGALTALGDIYRKGEGVPPDPALAMKYYRAAAANGKTDAMNNLGMAYMRGDGVPEDTNLGIQWLTQASELGNPYAAYHLGRAFRKGWGVPADANQALAYLRLSAQRNFLGAYTQIGDMLAAGEGVEKNVQEAYANYTIAIEAAKLRDTMASDENLKEATEKRDALVKDMSAEDIARGERIAANWIAQYGLLDFNLVNE